MVDLSKYTTGILTEDDRPLFQEAEASAFHGAPRGAYILIWIACAEGLKRKFREAARRDGQANTILGQIVNAENQQKSGFIQTFDESRLSWLRELFPEAGKCFTCFQRKTPNSKCLTSHI